MKSSFGEDLTGHAKKAFAALGMDIRWDPRKSRRFWLKNQNIKTVFDIGANTGQFAMMIHNMLPQASIYSFESLKDCYEKLLIHMRYCHKFKGFNLALGDEDSETEFHHCEFPQSSSLLQMGDLHKQEFPFTKRETIERIKVRRLDGIVYDLNCDENILVKIDVQGFEDKVILGGWQLISRAKIVIVETSFEMLYEGQPLFNTIYDILRQMRFSYKGNFDQMSSPIDGRILQSDAIFVRASE